MPERIPQSATLRVPLYAVLSSDHVSAGTGLTLAITISKNGAAFGNPSAGATNATAIGSGWYYVDLSATDTGTLGPLIILGSAGTADPVTIAYSVVSATNGGLSNLDATITSRLAPTVAGRTLDVSTGGEAGLDWANVGGQATAVNLSATTVDTVNTVFAASVLGTVIVSQVQANAIGPSAFTANAITASALATDAVNEIADGVWDEVLSGHLTAGTAGAALNGAGSAGDPWLTALPGAYGAGTAGNIIGNRLDAAVTSRLAPTVAARTLDVSATGEAGVDWANVGSPATTVNLSNTSISTAQTISTVAGSVASVAGSVGGNVVGSVGSVAAGGITAASIASAAITAAKFATDAIDANALAASAVAEIAAGVSVPTAINNADALLDRVDAIETGLTPRQALRVAASALGGKVTGGGTSINTFRNAVADSKNRIVATVDATGNRTAITYDVT